jgi:hypothetical protein
LYLVAVIVVILIGLPSRTVDDMPDFYVQYLGDGLWALMVFLLFGLSFPAAGTWKLALLALGVTWGIEFSQFYEAQWIRSLRYSALGGLILGFRFRWTDLLAYSCGVGAGVSLEKSVLLRRRIWVLVLMAIPVAIVAYAGILIGPYPILAGLGSFCPPEEPAKIEHFGSFTLPPSATDLDSYCSGMQNWWAVARFEMSPDDLEEFIASTHLEEPLSSSAPPEAWGEDTLFPRDAESYLYGKYEYWSGRDYYAQEVFIDTGNPDEFVVYVDTTQG